MSRELRSGGYHWQDEEHVAKWLANQSDLSADRQVGFSNLLDRFPQDPDRSLKVLDLGAGDGILAFLILGRYQNASADLVDFSEQMIDLGKVRLAKFAGRFEYHNWDLNDGDWPDALSGPFDAVVSSAAIHHLVNPRKEWLVREAASRLVAGGIFANYDLFRDEGRLSADDQIHDQTCATVVEALEHLRNAGYADVQVLARAPRANRPVELALTMGVNPSRRQRGSGVDA